MKSKSKKVFLVGLSVDFTKREVIDYLTTTFSTKNFFLEMKLKNNKKNIGWAVLHVKSRSLLNSILDRGTFELRGKKFFAKKYMDREELHHFKKELNQRRLFVKGLSDSVTNERLKYFFERYGELEDAYVIRDNKFGKKRATSLGYGFLIFSNAQDAEKLHGQKKVVIDGLRVKIEKYRSKEEKFEQETKNHHFEQGNFKKKKKKRSNYMASDKKSVKKEFPSQIEKDWSGGEDRVGFERANHLNHAQPFAFSQALQESNFVSRKSPGSVNLSVKENILDVISSSVYEQFDTRPPYEYHNLHSGSRESRNFHHGQGWHDSLGHRFMNMGTSERFLNYQNSELFEERRENMHNSMRDTHSLIFNQQQYFRGNLGDERVYIPQINFGIKDRRKILEKVLNKTNFVYENQAFQNLRLNKPGLCYEKKDEGNRAYLKAGIHRDFFNEQYATIKDFEWF